MCFLPSDSDLLGDRAENITKFNDLFANVSSQVEKVGASIEDLQKLSRDMAAKAAEIDQMIDLNKKHPLLVKIIIFQGTFMHDILLWKFRRARALTLTAKFNCVLRKWPITPITETSLPY